MAIEIQDFVNTGVQPEFLKTAPLNNVVAEQTPISAIPITPIEEPKPIVQNTIVPETPIVPETQIVPETPIGEVPEEELQDANTFVLITKALQQTGVFGEDFDVNNAKDAQSFIEGYKLEHERQLETRVEERVKSIEEKYQNYINVFENLENGVDIETAREVNALDKIFALNLEGNDENIIATKEEIIKVRYNLEDVDPDIAELAIKQAHDKNEFDRKFEESLSKLKQLRDNKVNAAIERHNAKIASDNEQRDNDIRAFNSKLNAILDTDQFKSLAKESLLKLTEALNKESAEIILETQDGKRFKKPVTTRIKFIHEVLNNPEVQLKALVGYLGIQLNAETTQLKLNNTLIDKLNAAVSTNKKSPTENAVPSSQPWKANQVGTLKT